MDVRKSLEAQLSGYVSKDYVRVSLTDSVAEAARMMQKSATGEALVFRGGEPIGIVTEMDILYKVVAAGRDPSKTTVSTVMSSPVESIGLEATVGDAIAKMSALGIRRLVVMKGRSVEGIVSQKRIVAGQEKIELPELNSPRGVACPYCGAMLGDAEELSKHMDQLHLGEGLLGGDRRKW